MAKGKITNFFPKSNKNHESSSIDKQSESAKTKVGTAKTEVGTAKTEVGTAKTHLSSKRTSKKPKTAENDTKIKCQTCDQIFNSHRRFQYHNCDLKCTVCSKRIANREDFSRHMKLTHPEKIKNLLKQCKICGKNFLLKKSFKEHMRVRHHDGQIHYYECDIDGKKFLERKDLWNHMRNHLSRVKCKVCGTDLHILSVRLHMVQFHSENNEFPCGICSKVSKSKHLLRIHEKLHDKKFECQICGKKLPTRYTLKMHVHDFHENPKSYGCELCGKKFDTKSTKVNHMKTVHKIKKK